MARTSDGDEGKRGAFSRTRGYFGKKIRTSDMSEASRATIIGGKDSALNAIRPKTLDVADAMQGLRGRHADGGRARFAEMVRESGLSATDLVNVQRAHIKFMKTYVVFAVFSFIIGMLSVFFSGEIITILGGGIFALFSLVFAALAVRADYSAWQIRHRRFGGLRDYIENRNQAPAGGTSIVVQAKGGGKTTTVSYKKPQGPEAGG